MAYITAANLKTYLGISGSGDDALIAILIANAQAAIDAHCRRTFEASADTTRYFTVGVDTDGRELLFDADLCAITTVKTNADDGSGGDSLTSGTDYITMPRNITPYYGLKLLTSSDYAWTYTDNPELGISVTGKWAYATSAPADIVQASYRLAGYYYRQKDAQVFDVTTIPEAGVITTPKGIPEDVKMILRPYVKKVSFG